MTKYLEYLEHIAKRLFDYGAYCIQNDFGVWSDVCLDFWTWIATAVSVIVAVLISVVLWRIVKYRIALSRARQRQRDRQKVADEEVMREARWAGDDTYNEASATELAREIRLTLEKHDSAGVERTFYDIIGVPAHASTYQISEVCLRLAEKYSPDKNPGDLLAARVFGEIEEIYETLMDAEKRVAYDERCLRGKSGVSFPELKIS